MMDEHAEVQSCMTVCGLPRRAMSGTVGRADGIRGLPSCSINARLAGSKGQFVDVPVATWRRGSCGILISIRTFPVLKACDFAILPLSLCCNFIRSIRVSDHNLLRSEASDFQTQQVIWNHQV